MPTERVYKPGERPDVEVLVDGAWYAGELRAWFRRADGWWANVSWRTGTSEQYVETVPAERVRPAAAELR